MLKRFQLTGPRKSEPYNCKVLVLWNGVLLFKGETALHMACLKNYSKLASHLVNRNANPNLLTNEMRQSALHYAVRSNAEDCIRVFVESNQEIESNGEYFSYIRK